MATFFNMLSDTSIHEVRALVSKVRRLDCERLSLEQVSNRMRRLVTGYPFEGDAMMGDAFYRARKTLLTERPPEKISDVWAPPARFIRQDGRMNSIGQSRFYCATEAHTAIWEIRATVRDRVTLLRMIPKTGRLYAIGSIFLGLERSLSGQVEAAISFHRARSVHRRSQMGEANYAKFRMVDDLLADLITARVSDKELFRYKPTIALADLLLGSPYYRAVGYPSKTTNQKGINVVMETETADTTLEGFEAWEFEMGPDSMRLPDNPELVPIHAVRRTECISPDGSFQWLPRGVGMDTENLRGIGERAAAFLARRPS